MVASSGTGDAPPPFSAPPRWQKNIGVTELSP